MKRATEKPGQGPAEQPGAKPHRVVTIPPQALAELKRLHEVKVTAMKAATDAAAAMDRTAAVISACLGVDLAVGKWEVSFEKGTFEQIEDGTPPPDPAASKSG